MIESEFPKIDEFIAYESAKHETPMREAVVRLAEAVKADLAVLVQSTAG